MEKFTIFETFVWAWWSHLWFKFEWFRSVYVNDNDPYCLETLLYNNPEIAKTAFVDDRSILDVDEKTILKDIKMQKWELDVCFGWIVCKWFSLAWERSPNDERSYFYHKQLKLVEQLMPKISIIENVKGILNWVVLSDKTPQKVKDQVDEIWQKLEDYKWKKAELRKKNQITKEFDDLWVKLRKEKELMLSMLTEKWYLISVMEDIQNIYWRLWYNVQYKILNSARYWSATKRERVIIVATRNDMKWDFKYPLPEYNSDDIWTKMDFEFPKWYKFKKAKTLRDAFSTIDYSNKEDLDNVPMHHDEKTVERFKYIPQWWNITDVMDQLPDRLKISNFYSRWNTMRLKLDWTAPTLVPWHSNFPVHPIEHRSITVREAANITGFPDNYKFFWSHSKRCEQVWNAVPPPLSQAIAKACNDYLKKQE